MEHEVENVMSVGELHKKPHWKVYHGTNIKQQQVYCSSEDILMPESAKDWDSTKTILESYLRLLPPGPYTIHFKGAADSKDDKFVLVFKISADTSPAVGNNLSGNPMQNMNPQFMWGMMQQQVSAEIGKATATITAMFERKEYERRIDDLEKKLKEKDKKKPGFDFAGLTGFIKEAKQSALEIHALSAAKPQQVANVAVTGTNANNVPADAGNKPENETEDQEGPEILKLKNNKLFDVQLETLEALATFWGGADEMVINLFCLKEMLIEKPELFTVYIKPQLEPYKEKLNGKI